MVFIDYDDNEDDGDADYDVGDESRPPRSFLALSVSHELAKRYGWTEGRTNGGKKDILEAVGIRVNIIR